MKGRADYGYADGGLDRRWPEII